MHIHQARLPLRLRPYTILATSPSAGLIEVVADAKSLDSIMKATPGFTSLAAFFRKRGDRWVTAAKAAHPPRAKPHAPFSSIAGMKQFELQNRCLAW